MITGGTQRRRTIAAEPGRIGVVRMALGALFSQASSPPLTWPQINRGMGGKSNAHDPVDSPCFAERSGSEVSRPSFRRSRRRGSRRAALGTRSSRIGQRCSLDVLPTGGGLIGRMPLAFKPSLILGKVLAVNASNSLLTSSSSRCNASILSSWYCAGGPS
jgi:hypothetical protein